MSGCTGSTRKVGEVNDTIPDISAPGRRCMGSIRTVQETEPMALDRPVLDYPDGEESGGLDRRDVNGED